MSHFSIAALQLSLASENNLDVIGVEIAKAKRRFPWLDMIVIGELCSYGTDKKHAERLPGKAEIFYCQLAKEHDVWLIPGSQYEKLGDDIYNTSSVINNKGEVISRYRKIYPFFPYETGVTPGSDFVVFDVPQGRIGLAICYDIWFPEVARTLACQGAEVIIYPTLTGTIDRPVELIMAQSTSVVNQCYTFSVNLSGELGNGQSVVVSPEGDVIYQAGREQEIIPIEVDFERVRRNRERGIHGLGQPLKSFRDNDIAFSIYNNLTEKNKELNKLGTTSIPNKSNY
jgi:predicted amidohydrolase